MKNLLDTKAVTTGVIVLLVGGAIVWGVKKYGAAALAKVGNAVNPISDKNLAYGGVNAVGGALTGDKDFSLGAWLYDKTHPSEYNASTGLKSNADVVRDGANATDSLWGAIGSVFLKN